MGDVACTLPAASALRNNYPDSEIIWLCDKRFRGVAECCEAVNEVVTAEKGLKSLKAQISELGEFDAAFDLQGLLKSALPVFLAKSKVKLGYAWQREGANFLVQKVSPDPTSLHVVDQYVDVVRAFGVKADQAEFRLKPLGEDIAQVQYTLKENGRESSRPFVLMNAGAGWATKRWPAKNFAQLTDCLIETGAQVGFLGTEFDRTAFLEVYELCKQKPLDLLGKTNVRQLVALIDECDLHVAGDTGSTHLAAGLMKPCVGLYTLTRPERCCAYGQYDSCTQTDFDSVKNLCLQKLNL